MIILILAVVIILLAFLLFGPLKVVVTYKDGKTEINVYLYNVRVFKNKDKNSSDKKKKQTDSKQFEKETKFFTKKLKDFVSICKTAVKLLKKYVSAEKFRLDITVGTGDAALTAISTGALWAAVYGMLGVIGHIVYINEHNVQIVPDYVNTVFSADGECIIKTRPVYIIIIAITILMKIKSLKGKEE